MEVEPPREAETTTHAQLPATTSTIEHYLAEISNHPVLSREEEYELATKYKEDGDLEAARQLIRANLKFVVKVANEYKNYGINPMDVIQEGNLGLMQAVKRFDPTRGYRLISYAVWWIRAYIQNYIVKTWSLVKVGTTQEQRKLFYKLRSTKNEMDLSKQELSPEDYKLLANKLGVSDKAVIEMDKRMKTKDFSLDTEIKDKSEATHLDFVEDKHLGQDDIVSNAQQEAAVQEGLSDALEVLSEREQFIIKNRVLTDTPLTLEEIGQKYEISRERVRQIESAALKKIRVVFEEMGIDAP
ncbi:MAG: RNA polymerase sigma factor RpoH [Candidatus Dadabacteria bacterium]|nr:RNA polymerase sigma factor RpoH [Candidatus Dadabacteria bacterium]NIS09729.1 RNA polymerase sigma factor RpoH [Candidatus Dadabacteria bacterium]NIV41087.1 RNA polymerase sigma factor RpoH [Candidatus Dadabacteria bacterium]NIY22718.1 RNA polymerase sigma factor RpoH [Candidatus Dadabacteria bacterium]